MTGTLRLSTIKFHTGSGPGKPALEIEPATVLIFVGPNNSGKSLALREIEDWCFGQDTARKVLDSVEVDFPDDPDVAESLARQFEIAPPRNRATAPGSFWMGQHRFRQGQAQQSLEISVDQLRSAVSNENLSILRTWLGAFYTIRLDGPTRFSLTEPKPAGDTQQHPENHLWALFVNDVARGRVRELTRDAFDLYFVIDPTGMLQFRIGMSSRPPRNANEEQGLTQTARRFHAGAQPIEEFSDGVKAFVGLVSALLSLPHRIMLIDDPDAFLHPPLARRLGRNLSLISRERNASLVVATHSSEFLIGCLLEAGGNTSVVRLTYDGGIATARDLSSAELEAMTRDPLLRSTGVLSALFHRAAVVTEADADRAFYDEMNRRLLPSNRGVGDALFLNAQNKQTIHRLVGPLRRIGIPAAAIVDLDVLKEGGTNWEALLASCGVPLTRKVHLETERAYLAGVFSALPAPPGKPRPIKSGGINALGRSAKRRARTLLNELSAYGLFLVPGGELESWLRKLGVRGKTRWLERLFRRIGQSDTDPNYLGPGPDDVWKFLDQIADWVNDPARLGIDE